MNKIKKEPRNKMDMWMLPTFKMLAKSERYSDCKFIIEDESGKTVFPCHKLILSSASEVFESMLYGGQYEESKTGEVTLNDVKSEVFEKFRSYIYGCQKSELRTYSSETLIKLIYFGNKYLIVSITTDCIQTLMSRTHAMDIADLLQLFQCAHDVGDRDFIMSISNVLKKSDILMHNSMYELSPYVYHQFVILTKNLLSEAIRFTIIEVFLKIHDCANAVIDIAHMYQESDDCDALSETFIGQQLANDEKPNDDFRLSSDDFWPSYIKNLISLIDFKKLTPEEFYDGPGKSSILTAEQKYELLYKVYKSKESSIQESPKQRAVPKLCNCCFDDYLLYD